MKRIGKIVIGVALAAGLIGGGVWYAKQRAANDPEQRYKLATIEKGAVTQTVSANGTLNPVVLVSVGTQVRAGQPIALVGSSGGQGRPALYFEIRRQGQAVNPQPWLGR